MIDKVKPIKDANPSNGLPTNVNKIELTDYDNDNDTKQLFTHAVRSAKARVELAELIASIPANDKEIGFLNALATAEHYNGDNTIEMLRSVVKDGKYSVQDVIDANKADVELIKKNINITFAMFRVACSTKGISDEWLAKLEDDEFLMSQDIDAIEKFVGSFRRSVGLG